MRILPNDEHEIRKERILQAVIHVYTKTGKPVGSSTILENFNLNLSAASVRNVLAELEKNGYLTHPHTSAGRVPTDLGYQTYVNSIVKVQQLAEEERDRLKEEYSHRLQEIEDLMRSTTKILSNLSQCSGFVVKPHLQEEKLIRVEFVPISQNQILAVLVSQSGMVKNKMISVSHLPGESELRFASNFLSEQLKDLRFSEAESRLTLELEKFQAQEGGKVDLLKQLSHHLFDSEEGSQLFLEGTGNILKFPEFRELNNLRSFAYLVDGKEALADVFTKELNKKALQVRIGIDTPPELKEFSVVSSIYSFKGRPMGVLGILGPKRMDYHRMMSIVETVSNLVNQYLDDDRNENLLED